MLKDVFYFGNKPNVHPRERFAADLETARKLSTTDHFWVINEKCDYTNFDWDWDADFLPDDEVWTGEHINIWPSQWQKDSGTWCVYKYNDTPYKVYRADVDPIPHKKELVGEWKIIEEIDESSFDFSWHPDPTDPPYIYVFGNQLYSGQKMPTLEYHVPGATERKYIFDIAPRLASKPELFEVLDDIEDFDYSWRPDPNSLPYIYVWGTEQYSAMDFPVVKYTVAGATQYEYIEHTKVKLKSTPEKFVINYNIKDFDFTWRPNPAEPKPYIYVWGNKHVPGEVASTIEYHVEGATEKKFVNNDVELMPDLSNWVEVQAIDKSKFDFTWVPDPTSPPYIYVWGNKWIPGELKSTIEYHVPGATEFKYMTELVEVLPEENRWTEIQLIDKDKFDLTWRPDPREPPYNYVWGNKWIPGELQPTLVYSCDGASEYKYMEELVDVLPEVDKWVEVQRVDHTTFDFTWRPDPREPAYIYVWGNKWIPAELKATLEYHAPGATERKYMPDIVSVLPDANWKIVIPVEEDKFDFTWRPDPREPAYIYVWGNQHNRAEDEHTIEYHTPGAVEYKYIHDSVGIAVADFTRWVEIEPIDKSKFDFTWRPPVGETPYIYVWGNKWVPAELRPTIEYHVPGATEYKYVSEPVDVLVQEGRWTEIQEVDKDKFDMSWRPDPREPAYIYVWGNKWIPGELQPTLVYTCDGASEYKYMEELVPVLKEEGRWTVLIPVDESRWDFTWRPDPREPAYIYVWGNQHNSAEVEPTLTYKVPGATEFKYMHDAVAYTLKNDKNWEVLLPVDEFDFTWRPDPGSPPYIYIWGNQWHDATIEPTVVYTVPGATEYKYMNNFVARVSAVFDNWETKLPVDKFDYSWRPNPHSPPYIYIFGNQWNNCHDEPTVIYTVPGATEHHYVEDIVAYVKGNPADPRWERLLPIAEFDYSWRPHPHSPPYIYIFGNKWNDAETEPTVVFNMRDATEYKFMDAPVALPAASFDNWTITNNDDIKKFDFTWRPNPHSIPSIYQWPDNGPKYTVPGATEVVMMEYSDIMKPRSWKHVDFDSTSVQKYFIKTTLSDLVKEHPDEFFWALNPDLDYEGFDFAWRPEPDKERFINVFGNEQSKDIQTYFVNGPAYTLGYQDYHYVEVATGVVKSNLMMFFVDKGNPESQERFDRLKQRLPRLQKTRFLNTWVDTINRCVNKAETTLFWILSSELDYTGFDFDYYPSTWQSKMVHVFGTQWSHWGNTYLINRDSFFDDSKYIKLIEHLSVLNFVKTKKALATNCLYDVVLIDHGNKNNCEEVISRKINDRKVSTFAYQASYLNTFAELLKSLPKIDKEHYIWICSSVCDYSSFDFTYICDPFAREQLHVFPSDGQKFGDTFLVNVNKLRELISSMKALEDYDKVNFNNQQRAKRLPAPVIITQEDTHTKSVHTDFEFPYAVFATYDQAHLAERIETEPMSLWQPDHKNIIVGSKGGSTIIVPKEAKDVIKRELYDYPYIKNSARMATSKPLDVVFISNGEVCADTNYEHLADLLKGKPNKLTRVDGVNGRVQAYHAAANASETPWFLAVFAKLMVNPMFDWTWQPDRLQDPKHYIFNATNAVNGLYYGHQAMIAYNKRLVLGNLGRGLDFTLDDLHESVDIDSGMALFNTDPYSTWRTAFREAVKLKVDAEDHGSEIAKQRLHTWLTVDDGEHGRWSVLGATDAVEFYDEVDGDIFELRDSYEWDWLKQRFDSKYSKYFDKK